MSDPNRMLSAGADTDDLLRAALGSANDDGPSPEEIARLTGQLASVLPAGALAAPTASTPATSTPTASTPIASSPAASPAGSPAGTAGLFSAKWLAGALVVGAVAGASLHAAIAPAVPVALPAASPSTSASPASTPAAPTESPAAVVSVSAPPIAHASVAPVFSGVTRPAPSASVAVVALPEPELLDRAHDALLHADPEGALALTRQHARAYPQGVLTQEREMIAIEALLALKRRDEAKARAAAFRAAYPGSSHIARLDAMLGAP